MTEPRPPHARAFDLPGWPCPPRVRDIPHHENSWGWISVGWTAFGGDVAQDELGYLWVNGEVVPAFRGPNEADANPGALVFWTASGIGLWVHRSSLGLLPSISRLGLDLDKWLPVNEAVAEWPAFIKEALS